MNTDFFEIDSRTELTAAELSRLIQDAKNLALIDVRSEAEFAGEHIAKSRCIPLHDLAKRAHEIDHSMVTVLVCQSGQRSLKAQQLLKGMGFAAPLSLSNGINGWKASSQVLEYGSRAVWSLERQVRVAAGLLVLLGVVLGWRVHPGFYGLSAFVGAGLVFAGVTDFCGMGLLLARAPWNKR